MVEGVHLDSLTRWMDSAGLGAGALRDFRRLGGGTQNILLRFHRSDRDYVLRRPPLHLRDNSNETMRREARMLGALANRGVPHPRLIAACGDVSVIGAAFYVMEPVEGFAATTGLPALHAGSPALRHRMGLAMVEAIATLSRLDFRAAGLADFGRPEGFLERQVARWATQYTSYGTYVGWPGQGALPGLHDVGRWLDRNRPAQFEPGVMHGDYHLANVMFRRDSAELAAIVDWELCTIGDPLLDLGWMVATWPEGEIPTSTDIAAEPWAGFPKPDELVAHYGRAAGREMAGFDWYVVLACYKLGIILEGTHARACAGKAPRETGDLLHAKAVALFDRALRIIGQDILDDQ